ncbi:AraC-type DNA-binding protein [Quadrisphaera granulorum]|uniref:AraC-like DNA-binding protein n=1 Tax=Quadrisphaera granulorum TaxID=317664 RepID=A0A316A8N9_9ACTN|nr:AraC family transcriptional regulator [Quadrisphaera granulorum]PWJ53568.1 AraC-like DNA-binding protein [Quadrisphaera granulorum]SZE96910.1 AraC-type DNA-binding protein [Quadrisphaera granulorum]
MTPQLALQTVPTAPTPPRALRSAGRARALSSSPSSSPPLSLVKPHDAAPATAPKGVVVERHTHDVDEARTSVGQLFCDHRLEPRGGSELSLDLRGFQHSGVGVVRLDYGTDVQIEPGRLESFYLVQVPLAGRAAVRQGGAEVVSTPRTASVLGPDAPVSMRWDAGTPQLILYAHRSVVAGYAAAALGRKVSSRLDFALDFDLTTPAASAWRRTLGYAAAEVDADSPCLDDARWVRHVRSVLVGQLFEAHRCSLSEELTTGAPATSRAVAAAKTLVDDDPAAAHTVEDLARHAGVSVRALQEGFRRQLGTTPMEYVRSCRLEAAHRALRAADPTEASVTDLATAAGFTHLGRFSVDYRKRFGCSPSATLRS